MSLPSILKEHAPASASCSSLSLSLRSLSESRGLFLTRVGAAPVEILREPAVSAVAYAQRSVHEHLDLAAHAGADLAYGLERKLPFEHYASAAEGLEQPRPVEVAYRALGGGVQGDRNSVPCADSAVADYEGVGSRPLRAQHLGLELGQLVIFGYRIVGDEYPCAEAVGVAAQFFYVLEAVACVFAGAEVGAGDIYGIGTAVYGRDADFLVSRRSQKLKAAHVT